ncbi:gluconolaconase [Rhodanobacter sp. B05]|jgi:L-arabinonolactonase|uniref:SMP-30/gluconolactonase/LRE family protein n=1 Tax=Rhodanobacter sp. B05 TaxID=1945859 RepID=UPI0009867C42|nr:SMP-30/gluconolactonase/LRE family protein [Rhodanobacter sp. B05]OOG58502.1 gluconolaconase [Rhodanobacter sp. B05]
MLQARAVLAAGNQLGEGVLWCARAQALYWTDIPAATLWRYTPHDGSTRQWALPERLASFALCEADGWLLLGLASQLAFFHMESGELQPIVAVEAGLPTRLNDGVCDRQGRFVFGTLHEPLQGESQRPVGGFYRLNADLALERLPLPTVAISNSLAFSPDGATLYYCDSPTRRIQCCDYHADGSVGAARTFVDLAGIEGEPDGSTVDAEGGLWNAQWGMSRVVRYRPDGSEDTVVHVPTRQPTRAAFGGPALDTLYITSAREGLSADRLREEPLAGALFAVTAGVRGISEARFAGVPGRVLPTATVPTR